MKGVKFYQVFLDKYRRHASGNCLATDEHTKERSMKKNGTIRCVAASSREPNSPVGADAVVPGYLRQHCRQITEDQARKLHPRLFDRIEKGSTT